MRIAYIIALLGLLVSGTEAYAWGPAGHRTVGAIADALLNPKAKAQVAALLHDDLDAHGSPSGRTTLAEVSTWSDEIRSTAANRPNWHFTDLPACGNVGDVATYCSGGECATAKIKELSQVLTDTGRSPRERNEALKWLVHLVGDIHQPLHAASNYYQNGTTDDKGNATDRGGNDIPVALSGVKTRGAKELHGIWDKELVNLTLGLNLSNQKLPPQSTLSTLIDAARTVPKSQLASDVDAWTIESNALARKTAYHFPAFACNEPINNIVVLSPTYLSSAKSVIREQLPLAGARLAHLLNQLIGK